MSEPKEAEVLINYQWLTHAETQRDCVCPPACPECGGANVHQPANTEADQSDWWFCLDCDEWFMDDGSRPGGRNDDDCPLHAPRSQHGEGQ